MSHPHPTDPAAEGRRSAGPRRLAAVLSGAGVLAAALGGGALHGQAQADPEAVDPLGGGPVPVETVAAPAPPAPEAPVATPAATTTTTTPLPAPEPPPAPATPAPAPEAPAAPAPAEAPAPAPAPEPAPEAGEDDERRERERERDDKHRRVRGDAGDERYRPGPRRRRARERREAEPAPAPAPAAGTPRPAADPPLRSAAGVPTVRNPTTSLVMPGPARIGVPDVFIDRFRIPPFLLPIYQAAGTEYGIRWEVLAAINEIETDYGRNLNVSSAGALGWMQFMPATWRAYGVDANGDRRKDPYNPVDAIFAAARYLKASGGHEDLRRAVFAYNHADWYVDSVLMRARLIGGLPADLVGSLTGLTQGRFPVAARARYAKETDRRGVRVFAAEGSAVIATHDGRVVARGRNERLGRFVRVRDTYGNEYTYGHLGSLAASHPVPRRGARPEPRVARPERPEGAGIGKERLFAHPQRQAAAAASAPTAEPGSAAYARELLGLRPAQVRWRPLERGSRVVAGTVLGRIGGAPRGAAPHGVFEIRPAGRGAPRIDPKPILDGWKLLESTELHRARGRSPFLGQDARTPSVGQILLMGKEALQRRVLSDPKIDVYACGRQDIRAGRIDRRVLATLAYLAANGLRPTVTSLMCGHGVYTASGNVSHHTTGTGVDIGAVNGIPVLGNQGAGSITDIAVRRILQLQGPMEPAQVITLMRYPGTTNTMAMSDHHDHIHIGWRPAAESATGGAASVRESALRPNQWTRVVERLSRIENPRVVRGPARRVLRVRPKDRARR